MAVGMRQNKIKNRYNFLKNVRKKGGTAVTNVENAFDEASIYDSHHLINEKRTIKQTSDETKTDSSNNKKQKPLKKVSIVGKPNKKVNAVKETNNESTFVKKGVLLCAIAKLENHYLREWVEHYKNLGFANICLYDNNDVDGERFEEVIDDYIRSGFVIVKDVRGKKCQQIPCYNECHKEYSEKYDWIAYFDIDEFLWIDEKFGSNINTFVKSEIFNNFDCIRVAWENYDDNDLIKVENGNFSISRFTRVKRGDNQTKIIVRTSVVGNFRQNGPHVLMGVKKPCNTLGKQVLNSNICSHSMNNAKLKHYRFKTVEEYVLGKMVRLWPTNYKNGGGDFINLNLFFAFNKKTQEKQEYANSLISKGIKSYSELYYEKRNELCLNIAIVGNSHCVIGEGLGKEIDKHDLVLRFNDFHIKGHEKDLGTKTNMIAVVSVLKNYGKTEQFLRLNKNFRFYRDDKYKDNLQLSEVFGGKVTEDDIVRLDDYILLVRNRLHEFNDKVNPSTGLIMLQYIADNFPKSKIDAYGFTFFKEKKIHFYDNKINAHNRIAELKYFDKYLKERIMLHYFEETTNSKTIAIIGNAPILKEYGEEIDAHDLVFRINDYKIKGFEKFIGTKTTDIVFTTRTPFMEEILTFPKEHKIFFYVKESKDLLNSRLDKLYHGKIRLSDITVADNKLYFKKLTKNMYNGNLNGGIHPSTGLMAIQYLVDNYKDSQIDVYGITFFSDKTKNSTCVHLDGSVRHCPHNGSAEKRYYEKYLKNKINLKK